MTQAHTDLDLMTPEEVCAAFGGIPLSRLYQWKARGYGPPAAKIGRRLMYRRADVVEFINSQFEPGAEQPPSEQEGATA